MLDVGCLFSSTGSHFMDPDERSFLRIGNSRTSALALGGTHAAHPVYLGKVSFRAVNLTPSAEDVAFAYSAAP